MTEELISPNMSRPGTPKDNAVMERYMRTFKNHKILRNTIQDEFDQALSIQPQFKSYRKIINKFIKSLNEKINKKSFPETPNDKDKRIERTSQLMIDPLYTKAFSNVHGNDSRLEHVEQYRKESDRTHQYLAEIAAMKVEVIDKTPFDDQENNLQLAAITHRLDELYELIAANPNITKKYVQEALEPLQETILEIDRKIDILLPKPRKERVVQKLRDPVDQELFPIFLESAGSHCKRQKELRRAQLRICYTLLYHIGLRVNELREIQYQEIEEAIRISQITTIQHKTKQSNIHVLSKQAVYDLKTRKEDFNIVFKKNAYQYLFGKKEPMHKKAIIRLINKDLKNSCNLNDISYNVKSHSFRIHVISSLLKLTSVQHVADIIGHDDIRSTLKYTRYSLSKVEIQKLMDKVANAKPDRPKIDEYTKDEF